MNTSKFESVAPESVNINSKRLINLIKRLENDCVDMHSLIVMKNRKIICETYYAPFEKDTLHRMFSIAKSFVSLGIGILESDGIVELDKSITEYFPEYEPSNGFHPYLIKTTIRDMLKMTTPHNGTTFNKKAMDDWTETYFSTIPTHMPGTIFSYDTSASHVLTALIEKFTDMSLIEFLRKRGLFEAGFSGESYIIPDGVGVSQGGSGLMAYPRDLLAVADIVMNDGTFGDKQMFSKEYIKNATSFQVANFVKGNFIEEKQGYGYQFWRTRNNGFMMYGMAGQIALCIPEHDLILITTADTTDQGGGVQLIFDAFWQEFFAYIGEDNEFNNNSYNELLSLTNNNSIRTLDKGRVQDVDLTYEFDDENPLKLKRLRIITSNISGKIIIDNEYGKQTIMFGFDNFASGVFNHYNCPYTASGTWVDENTLVIKANLIGECIGKVYMQINFSNSGSITVFSRKTEAVLFSEYSGFAQSVCF